MRPRFVAIALFGAALVAGCGSAHHPAASVTSTRTPSAVVSRATAVGTTSAGSVSTTSEPENAAGLVQAVRADFAGLQAGKAEVLYNHFSATCRSRVTLAQYEQTFSASEQLLEAFLKVKVADLELTGVQTRNVAGGTGQALSQVVSKTDPAKQIGSPNWVPWAYQDGSWVETDCSAMQLAHAATPTPGASAAAGG